MIDRVQITGPKVDDFARAFARLEDAVRRGIVDPQFGTLPYQGMKLVEDIMFNKTPPRKGRLPKGVKGATPLAIGRANVERSLRGLTRPLTEKQFTNPKLKKVVREGNIVAWNKISERFKDGDRLKNSRATRFEPGFYQKSKFKPPRRLVYLQPEVPQFKRYVKVKQMSVGKAKAAWMKSYKRLRGPRKIPSWIARHSDVEGNFVDGMTGPNPRIVVGNASSWARNSEEAQAVVLAALRQRASNMKQYLIKQMDLRAREGARAAQKVLAGTKFFTG